MAYSTISKGIPWIIQYSSGMDTGTVESSTLVTKRNGGQLFASMCLAGSDPLVVLNRRDSILEPLRRQLCETMRSFALTTRISLLHYVLEKSQWGPPSLPERHHVILGQPGVSANCDLGPAQKEFFLMRDMNMDDFPMSSIHSTIDYRSPFGGKLRRL